VIVRLEALRQLEALILCRIPELKGRICVGQATSPHELEFPSLTLLPRKFVYHPDQADESFSPGPGCVVFNVGRHEGELHLRLGATSLYQRARLEQLLIDLFLETPLHPGVLFSQVTACENLGPFTAAWEFEDDEWRDEGAFDAQFYSQITLAAIIPALVTRRGVYDITKLQLGLDFSTEGDPPAITDPQVELVTINQDGTLGPAP